MTVRCCVSLGTVALVVFASVCALHTANAEANLTTSQDPHFRVPSVVS